MRGLTVIVFLAGCSFHVDPAAATGDSPDLAMPVADLAMPDLAAAPDLLTVPQLGVTKALGAQTVDLTVEGTRDWTAWTTATPNTRQGGGALVATVRGTPLQFPSYLSSFSWSNGTPTATMSGSHAGLYVDGGGNGFTLSAPAGRAPQTLRLYLAHTNAVGVLHASLSDGSAAAFDDNDGAANKYVEYTLIYSAASDGQTLRITWVVGAGGGDVDLLAATLQ